MGRRLGNHTIKSNVREVSVCDDSKAYYAIIVTTLPIWALLTLLVVFLLITFHKNLRATHIYDNCTKQNAQYTYYVEVRTGDTSATFNKRRTTIRVDMFDENQNTLARVAVPGHIIFGKRDSPIQTIDDDKFNELRVTRFWLHRAIKLRKISTIRITHSCLEQDARVMIYAFQVNAGEPNSKFFFPIMSYITAYGSSTKPNASFDVETGSIADVGGSHADSTSIDPSLTWVDLTVGLLMQVSIVFYVNMFMIYPNSNKFWQSAIYQGIIVGLIAFFASLLVFSFIRYVVKVFNSERIGLGFWAYLYHALIFIIVLISTALMCLTAHQTYKSFCLSTFSMWLLSIVLSSIVVFLLLIVLKLIHSIILSTIPKNAEHYVLPDDYGNYNIDYSKNKSKTLYNRVISVGPISPNTVLPKYIQSPNQIGNWPTQVTAAPLSNVQTNTYSPTLQPPNYNQEYPQVSSPTNPTPTIASYKTAQTGYVGGPSNNQHPLMPLITTNQTPKSPTTTTYNQETQIAGPGKLVPRKIGSTESTGSTYYHQVMKNKGGVKSISQYGELMKQKKASQKK